MPNTLRRDIERQRAEFAYKSVESAVDALSDKAKKEYKSYCKKIPMLIKTNGLAGTYAFIFSKGSKGSKIDKSKAYGLIYNQTLEWLTKHGWIDGDRLMYEFIRKPSDEYRAVTMEVLSLFNWLRRFAEGMIEGESTDND